MSTVGAVQSSIFTMPPALEEPLAKRIAGAVAIAVAFFVFSYVIGQIIGRTMSTIDKTYRFSRPSINFKNLIGEEFLKEQIQVHVQAPFNAREASPLKSRWQRISDMFSRLTKKNSEEPKTVNFYEEYVVEPLDGMLLSGPPGCGKTYTAECIAGELGLGYIQITTADFGAPFVHQASINIQKLFTAAIKQRNVLILLDDADASLGKRHANQVHHQPHREEIIGECLKWLPLCSKANVFVVMTTNSPETIDAALQRSGRTSLSIEIRPPDEPARAELLKYYFTSGCKSQDRLKIDYKEIAKSTDGFTQADLKELSKRCLRKGAYEKREELNTEFVATQLLTFKKEKILQHLQQQFAFFCEGAGNYFSWEPLAEAAKSLSWSQVQKTVNGLEAALAVHKQSGIKTPPGKIEEMLREKLNLIS